MIGVLFLITCLMLFTRHQKNSLFQKWNNRIHKLAGFAIFILSIVHLFLVWPLRFQRPIMMYVLGIIMVIMVFIIILSYYGRKRIGSRWITVHTIFTLGVAICLAGHVYIGIHSLQVYKEQISNISVSGIDFQKVEDGTYIGEENVGYISCVVKVTVKNHVLVSVDIIEHHNERGKPAEIVIEEMVKKQSVRVDAVTGATNSSKVIMKAVENSLKSEVHN